MRTEKVINLETESQVKAFVEKIDDSCYYIDEFDGCWKGDELKAAIEYEENYDAFAGSYKEIEPYEFFYIEIEKAFYEYKYKKFSVNYECSSSSWKFCENEKDAFAAMERAWSYLTSLEKKNNFVNVYKCFGVPEYIECLDGEPIGRASLYRGNEYISYRYVYPYIINKIDDDISGDISSAYIVFDGVNYFYEKEIDGVYFRVEVCKSAWEHWEEIYLEKKVEIFA